MKYISIVKTFSLIAVTAFFITGNSFAKTHDYRYRHEHGEVVLSASERLIYIQKDPGFSTQTFFGSSTGQLRRNKLSDHFAIKEKGTVFEKVADKKSAAKAMDFETMVGNAVQAGASEWQPVFDQGMAKLIPTDQIIVGFEEGTTLEEATAYLEGNAPPSLGIISVREHRKSHYIVVIDNASGGRAFSASISVSELEDVVFAEPSFRLIMNAKDDRSIIKNIQAPSDYNPQPATLSAPKASVELAAKPSWVTLEQVDFESGLGGWTSTYNTGSTASKWGRTTYRSFGGTYSLYCAESTAPAPGPSPNNMYTWFQSETHNLTTYEEVYVEAWFYTINEIGADIYDAPALVVFDNATEQGVGQWLTIFHNDGNCTTDPTTSNGWRKVIYRVPPSHHASSAYFAFLWDSDSTIQREGCYIDNIRIVATTNVDTDPLGNDTYSSRLWSHRNTGQVAGLGTDNNDLYIPEAWDLVTVDTNLVLAIIDSGVDLSHPDLNLETGYDHDGSVGGGPRGSHGTACAGEAGAIRNNNIGVIGTAPGVKIMPVYSGSLESEMANAIDIAVTNGAKILSNSWGANDWYSSDIVDAIDDAIAAGCIVLFAAGNGPDRSPYTYDVAFPGSLAATRNMLCIGAASPTDEHKSASSSDGLHGWGSSYDNNAGPDVCASTTWSYTTDWQGANGYNPGGGITGSDNGNYTHDFGGTSSATPKVAGVVALMLSSNPTLTPAQVKSMLRNTADDINTAGFDNKTGAGRINAYMAVSAAAFNPVTSAVISTVGNTVHIDFEGTPGNSFKLKSTTQLTFPSWTDITTLTLDGTGHVRYSETLPPDTTQFYKTTKP
jgi:hypothetical protein